MVANPASDIFCRWIYIQHFVDILMIKRALYDAPNERRKMCVITGGEPSLQVDTPLIEALHKAGFYICIETNGTRPLPDGIDWITCSPKEASLQHSAISHQPPLALTQVNEVKVVFTGTYDPEVWRTKIEAEHWMLQPLRYNGDLLMESGIDEWSEDNNDNLDETVRYILAHPFWRLSVQLHKIARLR